MLAIVAISAIANTRLHLLAGQSLSGFRACGAVSQPRAATMLNAIASANAIALRSTRSFFMETAALSQNHSHGLLGYTLPGKGASMFTRLANLIRGFFGLFVS